MKNLLTDHVALVDKSVGGVKKIHYENNHELESVNILCN